MRVLQLRRRRDERGMTAFELVVGMTVMLLVSVGALSFLESAQRVVRVSTTETQSLDDARIALATISNEVHGAAAVLPATVACPEATCLVVTLLDPVTASTYDLRYRYLSTSKTLTRTKGDSLTGIWQAEVPVVKNVANGQAAVFCRTSGCVTGSSNAIEVVLDVNAEPTKPAQVVRLTAYVTPRNI